MANLLTRRMKESLTSEFSCIANAGSTGSGIAGGGAVCSTKSYYDEHSVVHGTDSKSICVRVSVRE